MSGIEEAPKSWAIDPRLQGLQGAFAPHLFLFEMHGPETSTSISVSAWNAVG